MAVVVGVLGLAPHRRRARSVRIDRPRGSTADGIGIVGAFTLLYVIGPRRPRGDADPGQPDRPPGRWRHEPRLPRSRATPIDAAPAGSRPSSRSSPGPSSSARARSRRPGPRSTRPSSRGWSSRRVVFGVAHVVAAYGLLRRRAWSGDLVGYLATIGIGVAAYGLLLTLTGADPFGATSALPSDRAWAEGVGLLVWMIGVWLVAARYALKGVPPVADGRGVTAPTQAARRPAAAA